MMKVITDITLNKLSNLFPVNVHDEGYYRHHVHDEGYYRHNKLSNLFTVNEHDEGYNRNQCFIIT